MESLDAYEWVGTDVNESCRIWMSHDSYEWVMTHMNESWLILMSHDAYEWVMTHMNESLLLWMSHNSHEWFMTHMNESWLIRMIHDSYEWVMTHMKEESFHTYTQVIVPCGAGSNILGLSIGFAELLRAGESYERVVSRMNESCHTWMNHGTYGWIL